ncbi:hypothetical protein BY458DRAFT_499052 [Sporodiniella umbellata]|nr:hypothetical protein BY458DRAFT_499052 [Sporodiniella umbellata]
MKTWTKSRFFFALLLLILSTNHQLLIQLIFSGSQSVSSNNSSLPAIVIYCHLLLVHSFEARYAPVQKSI